MDKIAEFLEELEDSFLSSVGAATPDLPKIQERLNQLWLDVTRYGPVSMPQIIDRLPSLGDFELPPPMPPPPPPPTWYDNSLEWVERHPWEAGGVVAGVVGTGLLVGYGGTYMRTVRARRLKELALERKQVIIVLGADTALGLPLVLDLERKGYIVVASVATPRAADDLERQSRGCVRALVLDPTEPTAIPVFLRSVAQALLRRFPINAPGDPFESSPAPIHSVISLLSLIPPPIHAPFENVSLENDYLPYLNATQITPLQVIQSILPLLRNVSSQDNKRKTIVVCLPATATRVGLPFSSMQSISAAGTLRATEVLRRELSVAALTGKSDAMKNIKLVVADIGSFETDTSHSMAPEDVYKSMERWSVSEKLTYGAGFAALSHHSRAPRSKWENFKGIFHDEAHYGVPRKPTNVKVFINTMANVVSNGQFGPTLLGFNTGLGRLRNWLRGERFSMGAGAHTYKFASFLPSVILDTLLSIPHLLISARNALLPVQPFVRPPPTLPRTETAPPPPQVQIETVPVTDDHEDTSSEAGSEADVESNSGDGPADGNSWIRLNKSETAT
ncbi:hypothetical protein BDZ89DRAFT_985252 [Hymenopellis radicata]|nr:hypothetical protein BDZ89DRAFT_985252 [Hymenopellis radicata]